MERTLVDPRIHDQDRLLDLLRSKSVRVVDTVCYNFDLFLLPLGMRFPREAICLSRNPGFLCRSRLRGLGAGYNINAVKKDRLTGRVLPAASASAAVRRPPGLQNEP